MEKIMIVVGILLVLAGLTGLVYGLGINVSGMMARGATDYSGITTYLTEWTLMLLAGLAFTLNGLRRK